MKKVILPILLATIWISISEFLRNTFVLRGYWIEHYDRLNLTFPELPINGVVWGIWSLCYSVVIFIFNKKFNLIVTAILAWFVGFVLMWLVLGNLGVLPFRILPIAVPLSFLEVFIASYIINKFSQA